MDQPLFIDAPVTGVHTEPFSLTEPFLDLVARFADLPGTVALFSGGDLDCARYHILGVLPWLQFSGRGRRSVPGQVTPVWQTGKDPLQKLNCKLVEKSASILVGNVKTIVKTQWIKSSLGTGWDMLKTLLKYKCEHPDVFVQWLYQSK